MLKSMEIRSGLFEPSVLLRVSAVEGCPLSGVPLYMLINCLAPSHEATNSALNLAQCVYIYYMCVCPYHTSRMQ